MELLLNRRCAASRYLVRWRSGSTGPPGSRTGSHVGARVGGDALASQRGLARPGRALGAPPACAFKLAWLLFSGTPVMGLPARGGPGLGSSSHEKRTAVRPRARVRKRVSPASPRCRASLHARTGRPVKPCRRGAASIRRWRLITLAAISAAPNCPPPPLARGEVHSRAVVPKL